MANAADKSKIDNAIALSPNVEGNIDYEVVILGKCKGAIEEILPLIKEVAPKDDYRDRVINAYIRTSKCTKFDANKPVEVMLK